MDKGKAVTAAALEFARLIDLLLTKDQEYTDQGQQYDDERGRESVVYSLSKKAVELGMELLPRPQIRLNISIQIIHLWSVSCEASLRGDHKLNGNVDRIKVPRSMPLQDLPHERTVSVRHRVRRPNRSLMARLSFDCAGEEDLVVETD
jgi:hypothetical protein